MQNEIWKDVKGFENLYQVSNLGRVKSLDRQKWNGKIFYNFKGRILKPVLDGRKNYLFVNLHKNKTRKQMNVHRLVAEAFIPNLDNLPCINHKNEIKTDNRAENLEWCTIAYNSNYGQGKKRMVESRNKNNDINELIRKIKETKKKNKSYSYEKAVIQYTMNGDFIAEYSSATEAERKTGICRGGIQRCCIGRFKQAKGYIWKYKEEII